MADRFCPSLTVLTFVVSLTVGAHRATAADAELAKNLSTLTYYKDGRVEETALTDSRLESYLAATQTVSDDDDGELSFMDSIIGEDDREQVTDTLQAPYRMVGRIEVGCTGTMISPRHVLTAGHCVYNHLQQEWRTRLSFSPARNGSELPFGTIDWVKVSATKAYVEDRNTNFDFAIIELAENIGNRTGWMAFGVRENFSGLRIRIAGYPGDKPRGTLWQSSCSVGDARPQQLYYTCNTFGGNSGGGIASVPTGNAKPIIYGVHTNGGTQYNRGPRLTKAIFGVLMDWKR